MNREAAPPIPPERNIILSGFMGTGKTAVGRMLADSLGRVFLDSDHEIERQVGMSISKLFATRGEDYFRAVEKQFCRELASRTGLVMATGGGMTLDSENRKLLTSAGLVICLHCDEAALLDRMAGDDSRPLLRGEARRQRARELLRMRKPVYDSLPFHVDTSRMRVEQVVDKVSRIAAATPTEAKFLSLALPSKGGYSIVLGTGALDILGFMAADRGFTPKIVVVTDSNVAPLYLQRVLDSLRAAGFEPFSCVVPAGEEHKTLSTVGTLFEQFLEGGLDRGGAVVALGGGVIGDLAGFAAATFMRGVAFIQCPTTLLSMVDASVGGKTGVDLLQGKNLVGAFKQPAFVVADTGTLATLPTDEIRTGMAEVIKHAVIGDREQFKKLEKAVGTPALGADLVERSVRVKIDVVEKDPFEEGLREVLNLGHTVGHAIEKCSNYALRHGDAVAVGLVAAARISRKMELCDANVPDRIESLLVNVGLPIRHRVKAPALMAAMTTDKKNRGGQPRFVLVKDIGAVRHGCEVSPNLLAEVLEELHAT
ncbi:MAG: 3-dehydroquinate synthase [Desulfomonile sp.]|nr:3-dehydroquinate synthase [Desulfomonile sp.]